MPPSPPSPYPPPPAGAPPARPPLFCRRGGRSPPNRCPRHIFGLQVRSSEEDRVGPVAAREKVAARLSPRAAILPLERMALFDIEDELEAIVAVFQKQAVDYAVCGG